MKVVNKAAQPLYEDITLFLNEEYYLKCVKPALQLILFSGKILQLCS